MNTIVAGAATASAAIVGATTRISTELTLKELGGNSYHLLGRARITSPPA